MTVYRRWSLGPRVGALSSYSTPSLTSLEALVSDPFFTLQEFSGITKRYIDMNTGSDSNDGSAAHPWASLAAIPGRQIGPNVVVFISPGTTTYTVPDGGLALVGTAIGTPAMVMGMPGRAKPIIDARPFSISGSPMPANAGDIRVRQVFDVSGVYGRIEHLDIRYGFRHNVVLRGTQGILRDCHLLGAFEDAIKVTGESAANPHSADYCLVINNDVEGYASGGVDITYASYLLITQNVFHDPQLDPVTGQQVAVGVGMKIGSTHVIVSRNTFRLPGDTAHAAIELGATGTNFDMPTEDCIAADNTISGYAGVAIVASAAVRAGMYRNRITDCGGGLQVGLDGDVHAATPNAPFCSAVKLGDNSVAVRTGGAFLRLASATDGIGFQSGLNVYTGADRFVYGAGVITFAAFKAACGTDSTSQVKAS